MSKNLTETSEFTATVTVPVDGVDYDTAASVEVPFQSLTNRTAYLHNNTIQGVQDSAGVQSGVTQLVFPGATVTKSGATATVTGWQGPPGAQGAPGSPGPQGPAGVGTQGPPGAQSASGGGGVVTHGTFANLPAAGTQGALYSSTDGAATIWLDNGSSWAPVVCSGAVPYRNPISLVSADVLATWVAGTTPPTASSFTRLNGTDHVLTNSCGALHYLKTSTDGGFVCYPFAISLSSATAYVEAQIVFDTPATNYPVLGIVMIESGTTKNMTCCYFPWDGGMYSQYRSSYSSGAIANNSITPSKSNGYLVPHLLRMRRSGANIIAEYSTDKTNWTQICSRNTTTVFTSAPDLVGIFAGTQASAASAYITHFAYGSL